MSHFVARGGMASAVLLPMLYGRMFARTRKRLMGLAKSAEMTAAALVLRHAAKGAD